jgi:glycerophosphoryl diester phosphodiesterase
MAHRSLICAHRGASAALPDNSVAAFEAAIDAGAHMIETDVRRAPNGDLVLSHDPLVEAGAGLVRLGELVALGAGRIMLDLELKEPGLGADVLAAVEPRPRGLIVTSFLPEALLEVHDLDPSVRTGLLVETGDALFERAADCHARILAPAVALVTPALLADADRLRSPLAVWTVNDEPTLARLVRDRRVGCVITDVPEVALRVQATATPPPATAF